MGVVGDVKDVVEVGGGWLQRSIATLVWVIRAPAGFIAAVDMSRDNAVRDASLFAAFVSLLGLAIQLPAYRMLRIEAQQTAFIVADTVITYGLWFGEAALLYLAARVLAVTGVSFQNTLIAFLYLTGLMAPLHLLGMPASILVRRALVESPSAPMSPEGLAQIGALALSSPAAIVSTILILVYSGYLLVGFIAALRVLYGISPSRAACVGVLAWILFLTWNVLVETPVTQILLRGFRAPET